MTNLNRPAITPGKVSEEDLDRNARAAFGGAASVETPGPSPKETEDEIDALDDVTIFPSWKTSLAILALVLLAGLVVYLL